MEEGGEFLFRRAAQEDYMLCNAGELFYALRLSGGGGDRMPFFFEPLGQLHADVATSDDRDIHKVNGE